MKDNGIIEKLRQAKKQSGLTLKQLSEKSGITQGTVNKIMSGALRGIKMEQVTKLAEAMGVPVSSLIDSPAEKQDAKPFYGFVRIACISPEVRVGDCKFNADKIIEAAKKASANGVAIALFPELAISAYTCGDLFFQTQLRKAALEQTLRIAESLKHENIVAVVGVPIEDDGGRLFNAAAVLCGGEILGIVPKTELPNYNEFYEKRWFCPAPAQNGTINVCGKQIPFGTQLIFRNSLYPEMRFACEICEDIWVANSPSGRHAAAGATVVLNLSASDEMLTKAEFRRKLVEVQSGKTNSVYAYCSCGTTESTSALVFGGHSIICENGAVVAEAEPFGKGYAEADCDLSFISNERARLSKRPAEQYETIDFEMPLANDVKRVFERTPFVPADKKELNGRCETTLNIQAYGLKKRMEHIGCKKLVLGVSGGSDSSLALVVAARALKLAGRPSTDIIAVTMPCFGTTERTLNNSVALAKAYGATIMKIDISNTVRSHFKDIGHDESVTDATYENAQARERTQVLMDIANSVDGLVVGTGDMSELALGWATYNGDHMSMYGVNATVPKTMVKALLRYQAEKSGGEIGKVLYDVLDTPVSPELLPTDGTAVTQVTEDLVGPYVLHDYFLYLFVRKGYSPSKIFTLAKNTFDGEFSDEEIFRWLKKFVWRFFTQQFKRSCGPDGVKTGSVCLSPTDWRMPGDACPDVWLADLERVNPSNNG